MNDIMTTIPTNEILEYKNGCFARVFSIEHNGIHMGWYYEDGNRKKWYQLFIDESKHPLCEDIVKNSITHVLARIAFTRMTYIPQRIYVNLYTITNYKNIMKKEEARKKFGSDVFYKLINPHLNQILVITNNVDYLKEEQEQWDDMLRYVGLEKTIIEQIDFDTAFDLIYNDECIIRRFYENNREQNGDDRALHFERLYGYRRGKKESILE